MVLNVTGGPRFNWTLNENRMYNAPIIVSSDGTEFYKQPAYYVMGHFRLVTMALLNQMTSF